MIAKIITGSGVKGLLQYLTSKKNEVLTTNHILPNLSLNETVSEFKTIRDLNKRSKKPVLHIVLSFPNYDNVSAQKMTLITEHFLKDFGAQENMYIAIRHFKESNPHVHCVVNRIGNNGLLLSDSFSHIRAKTICRKLENIYDLHKVSSIKGVNANIAVDQLRELIDLMLIEAQNLDHFTLLMHNNNYQVLKGRGISFIEKSKGIKIKGSSLGRDYSLSNIEKRIQNSKKVSKNKPLSIKKL